MSSNLSQFTGPRVLYVQTSLLKSLFSVESTLRSWFKWQFLECNLSAFDNDWIGWKASYLPHFLRKIVWSGPFYPLMIGTLRFFDLPARNLVIWSVLSTSSCFRGAFSMTNQELANFLSEKDFRDLWPCRIFLGLQNALCIARRRHERHERRSQAAWSFWRQLAPALKIVFVMTIVSQLICAGRFSWKELRSQVANYFVGHWPFVCTIFLDFVWLKKLLNNMWF